MPGFELIGKEEQKAVQEVFEEGGILFSHGFDSLRKRYHVKEFEKKTTEYFKNKYAVAVSSGTAGLKSALKAVGVNSNDEVITQAFNFIGTVEAIVDCGANPIICGVDKNLHIDIDDLKSKISKKTKAIIIVHMLGMGGPINELVSFAKKLKIPIIEDNCEAIGGRLSDNLLGTIGDIGVLSFDHGKMIACGEGGMILTNNKKYYEYLCQYRDHGHENNPNLPRGRDNRIMPGFNYRMTELQAAVGKVQLSKLDFMLKENEIRYEILNAKISEVAYVRSELKLQNGSYDTFIFNVEDEQKRISALQILKSLNFGTKNLPDAMEWHCSYFWPHAISKINILNSRKTYELLNKQIAIPIFLKREIDEYRILSEELYRAMI